MNDFRIATFDIETDPFLHGRVPMPFSCGFFDGETYVDFWGDDCIAECMEYIDSRAENFRIFVHNGGGFDFWYLEDFISNPVFFINKRIVKCGLMDRHELRDSYKMIPVALGKFGEKLEIDYAKLERKVRHKHRKEILRYLEWDCRSLYNLVTKFIEQHGDHLTIGSAALKSLRAYHPNKLSSPYFDAAFRPYFMGGRVECFRAGEISGDLKLYDVNSLYPFVMRKYPHPLGVQYKVRFQLPKPDGSVYFARIRGHSKGALPVRTKTGLIFPHGDGEFFACSHEIEAAKELGLLKVREVLECRVFNTTQIFDKYVTRFEQDKIAAEEAGDKGGREFAKLFLNNGYGKWGQDPAKYRDYKLFENLEDLLKEGYTCSGNFGDRYIGERPTEIKPWSYKNVAIAASITSAARAVLLRAIAASTTPLYCDTDSLICEKLDSELHPTKFGAWKHEASGDRVYIGGKKLYALMQGDKCVKKASKGVRLDHETIARVALGESVEVTLDAPVLRAAQEAKFIQRKIAATA